MVILLASRVLLLLAGCKSRESAELLLEKVELGIELRSQNALVIEQLRVEPNIIRRVVLLGIEVYVCKMFGRLQAVSSTDYGLNVGCVQMLYCLGDVLFGHFFDACDPNQSLKLLQLAYHLLLVELVLTYSLAESRASVLDFIVVVTR